MDLKTYLRSLPDDAAREQFAAQCETTVGHFRNVIYTPKTLSPSACVLAEKHSAGRLMRWDLRPNDWHRIWPELIGAPTAPPLPAAACLAGAATAAHL